MPELPEIETIRRGLLPVLVGRRVVGLIARRPDLRWPIPVADYQRDLVGHRILTIQRRGKYLVLASDRGRVILHLGMSGTVRVVPTATPAAPHDHLDFHLDNEQTLRLRDPRRFGAALWAQGRDDEHPLLQKLGPEPLKAGLTPSYLLERAANRRVTVKDYIMDSHVVAGIGNIYATEALFVAGIHPNTPIPKLSLATWEGLIKAIRRVLVAALAKGGTTLRDYRTSTGATGYFQLELKIYGRQGLPCSRCATEIQTVRHHGRASAFCPHCQPATDCE